MGYQPQPTQALSIGERFLAAGIPGPQDASGLMGLSTDGLMQNLAIKYGTNQGTTPQLSTAFAKAKEPRNYAGNELERVGDEVLAAFTQTEIFRDIEEAIRQAAMSPEVQSGIITLEQFTSAATRLVARGIAAEFIRNAASTDPETSTLIETPGILWKRFGRREDPPRAISFGQNPLRRSERVVSHVWDVVYDPKLTLTVYNAWQWIREAVPAYISRDAKLTVMNFAEQRRGMTGDGVQPSSYPGLEMRIIPVYYWQIQRHVEDMLNLPTMGVEIKHRPRNY